MRGILFASFGTSHRDAQQSCLDAVTASLARTDPEALARQAYTSGMIRCALECRGEHADDVPQALARMAVDGVTDLTVQPGHLLPGKEYDKLVRQVAGCSSLFGTVRVGDPLLARSKDMNRVVDIMAEQYPEQLESAVVLMGHGTSWFANVVYSAMNYRAQTQGRPDIHVACVEAEPTLETVIGQLDAAGYRRVRLAPLMLVAGDHAKNDMAGRDERSWASRLEAAGYEVEAHLEGMGEIPGIRRMYVEHAQAAPELGSRGPIAA